MLSASVTVLASLLLTTCASNSTRPISPSPTNPSAATQPTRVPTDAALLQDRTFWYEDDSGALFEVDVLRAWIPADNESPHLELEAEVENLLDFDNVFDLEAKARVGASSLRLSSVSAELIPGGERRRVRLRSSDVGQGSSIADAVITVGHPGTEETLVPLDSTIPVVATPPRRDVVPPEPVLLGGRATYRVSSSYLYPRLHGGQPGQWRLKVSAEIQLDEAAGEDPLFVRISLQGPSGPSATMGLQMVGPPSSTFVQTVVVPPPLTGEHRIVITDVVTGDTSVLPLTLESP